jgi:hypothetical protein
MCIGISVQACEKKEEPMPEPKIPETVETIERVEEVVEPVIIEEPKLVEETMEEVEVYQEPEVVIEEVEEYVEPEVIEEVIVQATNDYKNCKELNKVHPAGVHKDIPITKQKWIEMMMTMLVSNKNEIEMRF